MNQPAREQQNETERGKRESKDVAAFKPTSRTILLIQSDAKFEPRARDYIKRKYGQGSIDQETGTRRPWRIVTTIDGTKIGESHTIVIFYMDPERLIATGKTEEPWRERDQGLRENGKTKRKPEPAQVLESPPIDCKAFWQEGSGDNDDGLDQLALIRKMNDVMRVGAEGQPARAHRDTADKQSIISIRAT